MLNLIFSNKNLALIVVVFLSSKLRLTNFLRGGGFIQAIPCAVKKGNRKKKKWLIRGTQLLHTVEVVYFVARVDIKRSAIMQSFKNVHIADVWRIRWLHITIQLYRNRNCCLRILSEIKIIVYALYRNRRNRNTTANSYLHCRDAERAIRIL